MERNKSVRNKQKKKKWKAQSRKKKLKRIRKKQQQDSKIKEVLTHAVTQYPDEDVKHNNIGKKAKDILQSNFLDIYHKPTD